MVIVKHSDSVSKTLGDLWMELFDDFIAFYVSVLIPTGEKYQKIG